MAIYEIHADRITKIAPTRFGAVGLKERSDLQRLLRDQIDVISPDTLVIDEEFGDWEESKRRIDLLGLDKSANLVVIELKRTEDGGHMELQAVRYAAMISAMTFDRVVDIYGRYLKKIGRDIDPYEDILGFLEWNEPDEESFAQDVRIVLASAEFSKELTTAVLWLNDHGLDVRCIRMRPCADADRILLDVQQVIPLPEAEDYQIQIREKAERKRTQRRSNRDTTRYDLAIDGKLLTNLPKRWVIYEVVKCLSGHGVTPEQIKAQIHWKNQLFISVDGEVGSEEFNSKQRELYAAQGRNYSPDRWFSNDDQLIVFKGRTYCFINQWGPRAIQAVELLAKTHPTIGIRVQPTQLEG